MIFNVADLPAVRAQLDRDAAAGNQRGEQGRDGASFAGEEMAARCGESIQASPGRTYIGSSLNRIHRPA